MNTLQATKPQVLNPDIFNSSEFNDIRSNELQSLFNYCNSNQETDSQKLIATLLINATHKRFQTGVPQEHIYLKNDEVPQIQLFNILIEKFPFVKYSQVITNNAIIDTIGDSAEATIIDIGIGQGVQMMQVIEKAEQLPHLKKLHIIGIEPFKEALEMAKRNISAISNSVSFQLSFTGYHSFIEEFDFDQLDTRGALVVNASLALHHIQECSNREAVIASIRKLHPKAFILIEPNVNHVERNFAKRFMNCYHHYYNIFQVIDRLDIDATDKTGLKLFFGREIEDVIGKEEKDRFEKHEKAISWIHRLESAGFTMNESILQSPVSSECGVEINFHHEGFLGFTHEQETVLAVMYAN